MQPAVFEPITPASERPQTHALESGATGNGLKRILLSEISAENFYYSCFSVINYRLPFAFRWYEFVFEVPAVNPQNVEILMWILSENLTPTL